MELSKRNLIIVGGIILVLLLGIVLLGKKPAPKPTPAQDPMGLDFNVAEKKEEVVVFNTPTPIPTSIPTIIPTSTPTLTPTLTPTSIPTATPTIKIIPTRRPTRVPTATPTPDNSIKATGVSLSTTELTLVINQTHQVLSKVEPDSTTDKSVSWSSSDGNIAIVDSNGNITGKNLGETIITAKTSNGKTTIVKVMIVNASEPITEITSSPVAKISIYPENIRLNYDTLNLKVGEKEQLRLDIKPVNVTDYSTRWSSSNSSVAIVSIWGMVTAKTPGTTIISAKTVNGLVETATITVGGDQITTTPPVTNPTLQPTQRPTATPTKRPTATPTKRPTATPTKRPTATPTKRPTATPTKSPPTAVPSLPATTSVKGTITHETYSGMQYVLYIPGNYNTSTKWPLLVFMHGWGEHGTDISLLYNSETIPRILKDGHNYNAIIIAPQNSGSWSSTSKQNMVMSIINSVVGKYNVDTSRISLTGHSDACWGIWPVVRNNPTFFSAVVPIASSNPTSNSASGLTTTKIWYFYGTRDEPTTNRTALINAINSAGGDAKITAVNGGHSIMGEVYLDYKMIEWMLTQSRKQYIYIK